MSIIPQSPNTDFTSTTLNGSISDSVQTITVNDASTIVTPTYAVIDREDNNGGATANQREVVYISAKSGNDLTVTRGVDNSTARSHNDSAKFEPMITVGFWDDFYDAYDLDHNPADGSHDITKVAMLSGATVQTLTNKILSNPTISGIMSGAVLSTPTIITPNFGNSIGSNLILSGPTITNGTFTGGGALASKIITSTFDLSTASGNVAYTGVGFVPTSILAIYAIATTTTMGIGFSDSAKARWTLLRTSAEVAGVENFLIYVGQAPGNTQVATVASYDADGFTLTWAKGGTPTGSLTIAFICYR